MKIVRVYTGDDGQSHFEAIETSYPIVAAPGKKARSVTMHELAIPLKRGSAVASGIANTALTARGTSRLLRSLHAPLARKARPDPLTDLLTRKAP